MNIEQLISEIKKMDVPALTSLALILMQDENSLSDGLRLYKCAADQGHRDALLEMAYYYRYLVEDYHNASRYYREAILMGNKEAWVQYNIFLQEQKYGFYLAMDHSVIQGIHMSKGIKNTDYDNLAQILLEPTHPIMKEAIKIPLQRNEDLLDRMIYATNNKVDWETVKPSYEVYRDGKEWRDKLQEVNDSKSVFTREEQIEITPYGAPDAPKGYIGEYYTVMTHCEISEEGKMSGCQWYKAGFTDGNGDAYFDPKEGVTRYTLQLMSGFTYEHYVLDYPVITVEDKVLQIRNLNHFKSGSDADVITSWQAMMGYPITGEKKDLQDVQIVDPTRRYLEGE